MIRSHHISYVKTYSLCLQSSLVSLNSHLHVNKQAKSCHGQRSQKLTAWNVINIHFEHKYTSILWTKLYLTYRSTNVYIEVVHFEQLWVHTVVLLKVRLSYLSFPDWFSEWKYSSFI
jgi:hypothetical protein